ncbi:MAG: hypothetical protein ACI8ZF_000095 [Candidatus Midichloriaceae bacterium]|jgi:hypothetical protein
MKKLSFFVVFTSFIILGCVICSWRSSDINWMAEGNTFDCIYNDPLKNTFDLSYFKINLVKNSSQRCINPYFPSIHIQMNKHHNAWLHIVYTDSQEEKQKIFIDTVDFGKNNSLYPFYTLNQDFYDSPIWRYSLFYKPVSFWIGHAWAISIDYKNKTIEPIGGISWGFKLSHTKLRPVLIEPSELNKDNWIKDWSVFKTKLTGFKMLDVFN